MLGIKNKTKELMIACVFSLALGYVLYFNYNSNVASESVIWFTEPRLINFSEFVVNKSEPAFTPSMPSLRFYDRVDDRIFIRAVNPSSYISLSKELASYYFENGFSFKYVSDRVAYDREDYWQNAEYTLYYGRGDCEDYAIAVTSMFRALNKSAIVIFGFRYYSNGSFEGIHAWSERQSDFGYTIVDDMGGRFVKGMGDDYLIPKMMFNDKCKWQFYNSSWGELCS